MSTKRSDALSLRDRLSHLTFADACKLIGPEGKRLLNRGGSLEVAAADALQIGPEEARVVWDRGDS